MGKAEGRVESFLVKTAAAHGCLCPKFTSPGTNGMPDRIVIGHGKTFFIEVKAPGEKPRADQRLRIKELQAHGAYAVWMDTCGQVDAFFTEWKNNRYRKLPDMEGNGWKDN